MDKCTHTGEGDPFLGVVIIVHICKDLPKAVHYCGSEEVWVRSDKVLKSAFSVICVGFLGEIAGVAAGR